MSGMNPWLASIYGTDGADDLEKTAQTHLLQKLAEEQNLDLSGLSPEELQQLLQEVMGEQVMQQGQQGQQTPGQQQASLQGQNQQSPQSQGFAPGTDMNPTQAGQGYPPNVPGQGQHPAMRQAFAPAQQPQAQQGMAQGAMQQGGQQQPQGGDLASMQKEAQAKFEEADLLGRVMAHAYTQELEKIAASKTAGKMDAVKGAAGKAANFGKANKKAIGAAAGGAAAGFAAGRMSKKASAKPGPAFMKLAEMHAADILGAAGIDPQSGNDTWNTSQQTDPSQGQQPQQVQQGQQGQEALQGQQGVEQPAAGGEQFAQALDDTALGILGDAGYDVNEILARIQFAKQNQQPQA